MVVSGPDFELWIYIKAALLYISHDRDFFLARNAFPTIRHRRGTRVLKFMDFI